MKVFSNALLDELAAKASASPRKRAHYNVHASPTDLVQRFFVVADRGTYFRPHRHHTRSELGVVIRGQFEVITFDDAGAVTGRYPVGDGTPGLGFETPQGTWHTLVACTNGATFMEIKEGPYDPATAAEFASWAPAEGDAAVPAFLHWLRTARSGASLIHLPVVPDPSSDV